jgi:hypothetical protein
MKGNYFHQWFNDSNHTQCQWNDITVIGSALQGKDILNPDAPRNGPNLHSF